MLDDQSGSAATWPGEVLANVSDNDLDSIVESLSTAEPGESPDPRHGGPGAELLAFFGFWQPRDGRNLRVGLRDGNSFVPANGVTQNLVLPGASVDVSMHQMFMPDLPHRRCVVQLAWSAAHFFDNAKKRVAHLVSCDASRTATATDLGIPIVQGLKGEKGLELTIGIYAIASRQTQPILDLLDSEVMKQGLKLGRTFNPVFAMTVPYVKATVRGLIMNSRRNFKVAQWQVGFGIGAEASFPLAIGEYIFLDGSIRVDGKSADLDWNQLKWNPTEERPQYGGERFDNPYMLIQVAQA